MRCCRATIQPVVITYYGISCIKVQSGETVIAFDPPARQSGVRAPRFQADIALVSSAHALHNGAVALAEKQGGLRVLSYPGEYEIGGVAVRGIAALRAAGKDEAPLATTIYIVTVEQLRLCHLGGFGEERLHPETKAGIGDIDILFLSVGAHGLSPDAAAKIITDLEPHIAVPLYRAAGHKDDGVLRMFLKEVGAEDLKPHEKLTVRKKDVLEQESAIALLQPQLT